MAGKGITELPELGTTPEAADWFVVVDVSDTSESAQGTTKKVLKSDAIPEGLPYKSIVCLLSQSGTSAPTGIILQNEFSSGISFVRDSVGTYRIKQGTSNVVFTENKILFLANSGGSTYDDCFIVSKWISDGEIFIYNYGNGGGLQDDFTNMSIEIRVYP